MGDGGDELYRSATRAARMVCRLAGVPMPLRVPYPLMLAVAGLRELGAWVRGKRSPVSRQLVRGARRYTFLDSGKAQRELGYTNRPLEVMVRDTLCWLLLHGDLEAATPELKALRAEGNGPGGSSGTSCWRVGPRCSMISMLAPGFREG